MSKLFPLLDEVLASKKLGIKTLTIRHANKSQDYELQTRADLALWEKLLEDALYELLLYVLRNSLTYAEMDCLGTPVTFIAGLRNQKVEGVWGTLSFVGVAKPWIVLEESKLADLSRVVENLLREKIHEQ